jgi:hypothetical protein
LFLHARRQRCYRSVAIEKALDQIGEYGSGEWALEERRARDVLAPDPADVNEHLV